MRFWIRRAFAKACHTAKLLFCWIVIWKTGISRLRDSVLKRIMLSYRDGYTTEEYEYTAKAGVIKVPMPAFGAMVLYHKCENPTIFVEEEN